MTEPVSTFSADQLETLVTDTIEYLQRCSERENGLFIEDVGIYVLYHLVKRRAVQSELDNLQDILERRGWIRISNLPNRTGDIQLKPKALKRELKRQKLWWPGSPNTPYQKEAKRE